MFTSMTMASLWISVWNPLLWKWLAPWPIPAVRLDHHWW
jgi:hypothetical protein